MIENNLKYREGKPHPGNIITKTRDRLYRRERVGDELRGAAIWFEKDEPTR
ncbi:MAG: hypothetical protein FWC68_05775 [Oscillospiraceae bacterium]|nr:hypothetical protein [Oscillospiraceae bacterium]